MSQFVVGVTGGIGSGKTTVTDLFAQKGIVVVDADVIAREVVAPGTKGLDAIVDRFGEEILLVDGTLDRNALRTRVFSHPADKRFLDSLLHPLIRDEMISQTQAASSIYSILSIPLLVENQLQHLVDRVLVVDVDEQIQLERASQRDKVKSKSLSTENEQAIKNTIQAIMKNQASRQQRLAVADDVVNNNGNELALVEQVENLHNLYVNLAQHVKQK
uniref:dephospho-CoA kinase n=1 Tax=Ningiella ruwaisensis TaxID=2364274 RepID=UPI0010A04403|nr:dephospho-CoA kinase [Ningiella ruwaisensis]